MNEYIFAKWNTAKIKQILIINIYQQRAGGNSMQETEQNKDFCDNTLLHKFNFESTFYTFKK